MPKDTSTFSPEGKLIYNALLEGFKEVIGEVGFSSMDLVSGDELVEVTISAAEDLLEAVNLAEVHARKQQSKNLQNKK